MVCDAMCTSKARLDGKTAVITGCNTGIGKYTAQDFFIRGACVIMACRNKEKADEAAEEIKTTCKAMTNLGELVVEMLDLSSFKSIRSFAEKMLEREEQINLLINNAGVMMCPYSKTEDGFEMQFGTNHLGHFLLTLLLLPRIIQSAPARIVTVSSKLHDSSMDLSDINWEKTKYSGLGAYKKSKLANILFTKELAYKLKENNIENVTTYSLHPGVIKTELSRHIKDSSVMLRGLSSVFEHTLGWIMKTPKQGAQTTIYCAVDEKCAEESGLYYAECAVTKTQEKSTSNGDAEMLWKESLRLVQLDEDYNPFKKT